jgi:hypothetical protein
MLGAICGRGGCPCAVTVNERGEQAAINVSGDGNVIWPGYEMTDGFFPVPIALDLVSVFIKFAASVAVG